MCSSRRYKCRIIVSNGGTSPPGDRLPGILENWPILTKNLSVRIPTFVADDRDVRQMYHDHIAARRERH
jgi:hypothetical protein